MNELINKTLVSFAACFNKSNATAYAFAPGRVNIIGEHTDYNDGFVMPCAIDFGTVVCGARNDQNLIRMVALDFWNDIDIIDLSQPVELKKNGSWCNYLRGVVKVFLDEGFKLHGCDIAISGNVPLGAGLSSSASLEVAMGAFLNGFNNLGITSKEIALLGQRAEHFAGCNCGIMDQMISATGKKDHAVLIDCRSLDLQNVPVPNNLSIMIVNSKVKHDLVAGEYNTRREQCENAAKILGVSKLRDASLSMLEAKKGEMTDVVFRRARHVIGDCVRCQEAIEAFKSGDISSLSRILGSAHRSLRDDFEVSIPEIDFIVDTIYKLGGTQVASRITGGGFGGCVVALMPHDMVETVKQEVLKEYKAKYNIVADVYVCTPSDGACFENLN